MTKCALPHSLAREILKSTGLNASTDGIEELQKYCQSWLLKVAKEAGEVAQSYHRKTILDRDVKLAVARVK